MRDLEEKESSLLPRFFCQNVREVSGLRIKVFAKHYQKLFIKSCVGRNFCDISGSVTQTRNNRLRFGDDHRGFVVRKWEKESEINYQINLHKNCVDKKKNRLGVCCFDRRKLSIFNRRRVRQDEIQVGDNHLFSHRQTTYYYVTRLLCRYIFNFQINEEGVLGLDTIPQDDQSDEVFINEDLLNGIFAGQAESFEEDQSIEDIINQVKNEQDETPSILMVKDNGASGKDVVLKFPESDQEGNFQGPNPIVVINIRYTIENIRQN